MIIPGLETFEAQDENHILLKYKTVDCWLILGHAIVFGVKTNDPYEMGLFEVDFEVRPLYFYPIKYYHVKETGTHDEYADVIAYRVPRDITEYFVKKVKKGY